MTGRHALLALALVASPLTLATAQDDAGPPAADPGAPGDAAPVRLLSYPKDVRPPRGTQYPCEFTAIPAGLPGITAEHAPWVEHACATIVKAIHAKLPLLEAMRTGEKRKVNGLHRTYQRTLREALRLLRDAEPPAPLVAFRDDVVAALDLQLQFFAEAVSRFHAQPHPAGYDSIWQVGQGREASQRLLGAWGKLQALYRGLPKETHDSLYHHLCALDLF